MSRSPAIPGSRPPARVARAAGALALALGVVAGPVATTPPAAATTAVDEQPAARLVVADLTAVVGPVDPAGRLPEEALEGLPPPDVTARLLVENTGDIALRRARLVVEVGRPIEDRVALRAALDDDVRDPTAGRVLTELDLGDLEPGAISQLRLEVPGDDGGFAPPPGSTSEPVRVVPLTLTVLVGTLALDEVRTGVVGVSGAQAPPLEGTVVLPIDHEPEDGPVTAPAAVAGSPAAEGAVGDVGTEDDGQEDVTDEDVAAPTTPPPDPALLPGGRVDRLTAAVEAAPTGTIAVAPAVHTLESLERAGPVAPTTTELLERIRVLALADRTGLVSTPLMLASVPSLAADESTAILASAAVAEGRRRLGSVVGASASASHLGVGSQTPASLDLTPGDVLVVRWDEAAGVDLVDSPETPVPPAVRTAFAPSGRSLQVLVADPWIERAIGAAGIEHRAAVDAHRVVVETAVLWAEEVTVPGRAVAIVPPLGWEPGRRTATEVTTRLAAAPWLRLSSPTGVVQQSLRTGTGWIPAPTAPDRLESVVPRIGTVAARFESLRSAVPAELALPVFDREDDLLRAATAWPTANPVGRAREILDDLDAALDAVEGVTTVPADSIVSLASERGVVPVTVRRQAGPPLDVLVQLVPQGRLVVEGESTIPVRLEADGTSTVGVQTRALGTGTIPVEVRVLTPDGATVLADAVVRVRATAVSRPALGGIALVVLLLLLLGRRRRTTDDRPRLEVVR